MHVRTQVLVGPAERPADLSRIVLLPFRTFHVRDGNKHRWKAGAHVRDGLPYLVKVQQIFQAFEGEVGLGVVVHTSEEILRAVYLTNVDLSSAWIDGIPDGAVEFVGGSYSALEPWAVKLPDLWRLS